MRTRMLWAATLVGLALHLSAMAGGGELEQGTPEQTTAAAAAAAEVNATLVERVENLFDEHVLTLLGLLLAGSLMAIATTAVEKRILRPLPPDAPKDLQDSRYRLYTLSGMAFGGLWTFAVTMAYLTSSLGLANLLASVVAIGLALAAAAITPKVYDVLDAVWAWLWTRALPAAGDAALRWIKRRGGGKDQPPPSP